MDDNTYEKIIDTSIAYLIGRTSRSIIKRLTKKFVDAGFEVSYEQWSLLVHLYRKDGLTQQELSKLAVKDKAAITRLINALEKKNIVLRIPDKVDKRNKLIYLTHRAKGLRHDLIGVVEELLEEAKKGISKREMDQCKATLNKIFANYERLNN
jgi:DNA-binding MarR family transcriptional regulator